MIHNHSLFVPHMWPKNWAQKTPICTNLLWDIVYLSINNEIGIIFHLNLINEHGPGFAYDFKHLSICL